MARTPARQAGPTARAAGDALISARQNRRMFDRIARRYDLMNHVMSLGLDGHWRAKAVSRLEPRAGGRYLDVGCGTGDMAVELLRQAPGAQVVGIDPARRMLDVAAGKLARAGLSGSVELMPGDATELAFDDASFAGVMTAFCIRNVTDRARAVAEMRRVLIPGGRAVILELTVPDSAVLRLGHRLYTRWFVPLAGRLIAGNAGAYTYLVDSVEDFPRPPEITSLMDAAGLVDASHVGLLGGTVTIFTGTAP